MFGHSDVVKQLIAAGSDITWKNQSGYTALQVARQQNFTSVVEYLEERRACNRSRTNSKQFNRITCWIHIWRISSRLLFISFDATTTKIRIAQNQTCWLTNDHFVYNINSFETLKKKLLLLVLQLIHCQMSNVYKKKQKNIGAKISKPNAIN